MGRLAQVGIAISALGVVLMLMGLYPGVTGIEPTPGIGIIQILAMLVGFAAFIFGALMYVKYTFFLTRSDTLMQQIGTRLAMTGLLLAMMAGLADALGYGSHGVAFDVQDVLGPLQATGIIASYILSCIGVLVYAIGGNQPSPPSAQDDETHSEQATSEED